MRGLGFSELFAATPDVLVLVFALLTQTGDPWFLLVLVVLLYWLAPASLASEPRRTGALLVGLATGALLLTVGLKSLFGLPRPPGAASATPPVWLPALVAPVFENVATGTGFGFPSGHAIGTTVVYGGLATVLDVWDRRRRVAAAATVVGLVGLSRVVLGVHYGVDIVVGVAVGLAFLVGALRVADGRPDRLFGVVAVVGLLALVVAAAGGHAAEVRDAVAGLGGALGGLVALRRVGPDELTAVADTPVSPVAAVVGLAVTGGLWAGVAAMQSTLPVTVVVVAVAVATVVAYPRLVATVRR